MINLALTLYPSAVLPISYLVKGIFLENPYQVCLHILPARAAFGKYFFFSEQDPGVHKGQFGLQQLGKSPGTHHCHCHTVRAPLHTSAISCR